MTLDMPMRFSAVPMICLLLSGADASSGYSYRHDEALWNDGKLPGFVLREAIGIFTASWTYVDTNDRERADPLKDMIELATRRFSVPITTYRRVAGKFFSSAGLWPAEVQGASWNSYEDERYVFHRLPIVERAGEYIRVVVKLPERKSVWVRAELSEGGRTWLFDAASLCPAYHFVEFLDHGMSELKVYVEPGVGKESESPIRVTRESLKGKSFVIEACKPGWVKLGEYRHDDPSPAFGWIPIKDERGVLQIWPFYSDTW